MMAGWLLDDEIARDCSESSVLFKNVQTTAWLKWREKRPHNTQCAAARTVADLPQHSCHVGMQLELDVAG